jgi:hypothetical protein
MSNLRSSACVVSESNYRISTKLGSEVYNSELLSKFNFRDICDPHTGEYEDYFRLFLKLCSADHWWSPR